MKIKYILITSCIAINFSCRQTEKSTKAANDAIDVYYFSKLTPQQRLDSSLALVNKSIEYDDENFSAYTHKAILLFQKKDLKGLLETNSKIIEIRPGLPYYLGQRAIYYELSGDSIESEKYYIKAISEYQRLIKQDSSDFDLSLEYVTILQAHGDTTIANLELLKMKGANYPKERMEILDLYKHGNHSKEILTKYWKGEIQYQEIGAQLHYPKQKI